MAPEWHQRLRLWAAWVAASEDPSGWDSKTGGLPGKGAADKEARGGGGGQSCPLLRILERMDRQGKGSGHRLDPGQTWNDRPRLQPGPFSTWAEA